MYSNNIGLERELLILVKDVGGVQGQGKTPAAGGSRGFRPLPNPLSWPLGSRLLFVLAIMPMPIRS